MPSPSEACDPFKNPRTLGMMPGIAANEKHVDVPLSMTILVHDRID